MIRKRRKDQFFSQKAFLLLVFFIAQASFFSSQFFALDKINLVGNFKISQAELLNFAHLHLGENFWLAYFYGLEKKFLQHPWVRKSQVDFQFPRSLEIKIIERIPIISASNNGKDWYGLDEEGVILTKLSQPLTGSFPGFFLDVNLKEGEKIPAQKVKLLLDCLCNMPPEDRELVKWFAYKNDKLEFCYGEQSIKVKLGKPEKLAEKFLILKSLLAKLEKEKRLSKVNYIDFTHQDCLVKFK